MRFKDHIPIVPEHDIIALVRVDIVTGGTTKHDVCIISGTNFVRPADAVFDGLDPAQRQPEGRYIDRARAGHDLTAVTDDQVCSLAGVDIIVTNAADDDVTGTTRPDIIVAAHQCICRYDPI